uniref:glucuronosyltransferase n=1 Tax=Trichuris muris TaxID=70415 RepID=A0A5S6QTW1_TRIMR
MQPAISALSWKGFVPALLGILLTPIASSLRIAIFVPDVPEEARNGLNQLAQQLAYRNHYVLTFRALLLPEIRYLVMHKLNMVEEIKLEVGLPVPLQQELRTLGGHSIWTTPYGSTEPVKALLEANVEACRVVLNSDLTDHLRTLALDLAVVYSGNPCYLGIVQNLSLPFVYFDTDGLQDETLLASGIPMNPTWLPPSTRRSYPFRLSVAEMIQTFVDFCRSALSNSKPLLRPLLNWGANELDDRIMALFKNDSAMGHAFRHLNSFHQIRRLAALYFANSDFLIEPAERRLSPKIVYVGGYHQELARPLFEPYNNTVASAHNGVIVISFGNVVNCSAMPPALVRVFLQVFRRLPNNHFFWRVREATFDGVDASEIPSNVNISRYLPQVDLLGATEVRLLITHGGAQSILEAVTAGVPVLGIPLLLPNYNTMRKLEARGMALIIEKEKLTVQSLLKAIRKLLEDKKYSKVARQLSRIISQRPLDSLEKAISWLELIGRHKHAVFPKSVEPISFKENGLLYSALLSMFTLIVSIIFYNWSMMTAGLNPGALSDEAVVMSEQAVQAPTRTRRVDGKATANE